MPRRAAANRREVQPDAVYNNRLVTQLINKVLLDGKKATAERIRDRCREVRGWRRSRYLQEGYGQRQAHARG